MKAAKQFKEEWEEINLLRLINLASLINEKINKLLRHAIIVANVLFYITYKACKGLYLIIKLLLLTQPSINKIERDETWIFRQIK